MNGEGGGSMCDILADPHIADIIANGPPAAAFAVAMATAVEATVRRSSSGSKGTTGAMEHVGGGDVDR